MKRSESENKEQFLETKRTMTPLQRFRSIARSVLSQNQWTKALQTKIAEEHSKEFNINRESGGQAEVLTFNASGKSNF